jgi:hypothetical protein
MISAISGLPRSSRWRNTMATSLAVGPVFERRLERTHRLRRMHSRVPLAVHVLPPLAAHPSVHLVSGAGIVVHRVLADLVRLGLGDGGVAILIGETQQHVDTLVRHVADGNLDRAEIAVAARVRRADPFGGTRGELAAGMAEHGRLG